jgi:DNA-binding transcriptional LysR family regulator
MHPSTQAPCRKPLPADTDLRKVRCHCGNASAAFGPDPMNHLRFLRYVDEVARSGSIRQAAEWLHVAASAVNRRIQDIEEELGTPLFERLPRGMRPTPAGELFVRYIRDRASQLDEVRSQIEELQGLRRGRVRMVGSQALAPSFLGEAVAAFRRGHPLVDFQVDIGDHLQALHWLRQFEADLALVFNLAPEADVEVLGQVEQRLLCLMHRSHPLAKRPGGLRLRDCAEHPVVLPNMDIGGRQLLDRFLLRSPVKLRPVIESNSFEFLRSCLRHEHALTFQITIGAVTERGELVVKEVEDRGFPRGQLVLASLHGRQLPVVAQAFAQHLLTRMREAAA